MLKRLLKAVAWLLIVVALVIGVGLAWIAFVPAAAYNPPEREIVDETAFAPEELVGGYRDEAGQRWTVTWGALNGLQLNRFVEPVRIVLVPSGRDRWSGDEGEALEVLRDDDQRVTTLVWDEHRLERLAIDDYRQSEVRYRNGDVELVGLQMIPTEGESHPGVVFIHGSGDSSRDNLWYLAQADYLARRGFAVLLPDKRGCGASGGEWHVASFDDFAGDAIAAVDFLAAQPGVDPERTGLLGISQGGWIAPLAADGASQVRFVINLSGSATPPRQQLRHEIAADIRNGGAPAFVASWLAPVFARRAISRRSLWWQKNGDFDPLPHWSRLDVPVLVVYGRLDEDDNVPVQRSLDLLEPIAASRPEGQWTFHVYDGMGHGMIDAESGWISETYLDRLASWIPR